MNQLTLLRRLIVIIIIIGGTIIIIIFKGPIPEPECLVCGRNLLKLLGVSQLILTAYTWLTASKINNNKF